MTKKSVLAIGVEPAFADFTDMPGLTPDMIRQYIDAHIKHLRDLGFDADSCLTDLGATAESVVKKALASKSYDCIVIGAGLREPVALLILFEKIINLVHISAPRANIAFNTKPGDTAEAVQRWISA